jgi:hypothetical protein
MGNLYNIEQKAGPQIYKSGEDVSKTGLDEWKNEVRKQVMEKLKGYSPEQVTRIMQTTFGDSYI